jgi:hypothetical protein
MRFGMQYRYAPSWTPLRYKANSSWTTWEKQSELGWMIPPERLEPKVRLSQQAKARQAYTPWLSHFAVAEASDQALHDLVDLCRAEGIGVVLVWLPEAREFQEMYGPGASETAEVYFRRVEKELGVPYINARNWIADDKFLDGHHLSASGAMLFTSRLAAEVMGPLFPDVAKSRADQQYVAR